MCRCGVVWLWSVWDVDMLICGVVDLGSCEVVAVWSCGSM